MNVTHHIAYNDYAIFGLGKTPEAAMKEAKDGLGDIGDDMRTMPCSESLERQIDREGGELSYGELFVDGHGLVACTDAEEQLKLTHWIAQNDSGIQGYGPTKDAATAMVEEGLDTGEELDDLELEFMRATQGLMDDIAKNDTATHEECWVKGIGYVACSHDEVDEYGNLEALAA